MQARILLPTLISATLLSTAAFADRTENDQRSPIRTSVKERVLREARAPESRERVQTKEAPARPRTERAAPARLSEKRGCATDDGGSCSAKQKAEKTATQTKASKASAPPMPTKLQTQRGCTTDDGSGCATKSEKSTENKAASTGMAKHVVEKTNRWSQAVADEIMRMRLEIEAERLLDMLNIKTCVRNGTCGEDSY